MIHINTLKHYITVIHWEVLLGKCIFFDMVYLNRFVSIQCSAAHFIGIRTKKCCTVVKLVDILVRFSSPVFQGHIFSAVGAVGQIRIVGLKA